MPILGSAAAIALLSAMDGLIKYATVDFTTAQIVLLRYGAGTLWAGLVFLRGSRRPLSRGDNNPG